MSREYGLSRSLRRAINSEKAGLGADIKARDPGPRPQTEPSRVVERLRVASGGLFLAPSI